MDFLSLDSCNDTSDSLNFIIAKHLRDHFYYIAIEGKHNVYTEQDFIFLINKNNSTSSGYAIGLHPTDDVESYKTHIKIIKEKTNTPCIWFSYPLTSLLKETLGKEGFLDIGDLIGVCYLFQKKKISPTASANCELLTVTTHELFKAWCKINATVWNRSFESTYDFFRGISPSINTFSRVQLFLLKIDNTFVGSSALDIIGNVAGFYWDCILPSYRRLWQLYDIRTT